MDGITFDKDESSWTTVDQAETDDDDDELEFAAEDSPPDSPLPQEAHDTTTCTTDVHTDTETDVETVTGGTVVVTVRKASDNALAENAQHAVVLESTNSMQAQADARNVADSMRTQQATACQAECAPQASLRKFVDLTHAEGARQSQSSEARKAVQAESAAPSGVSSVPGAPRVPKASEVSRVSGVRKVSDCKQTHSTPQAGARNRQSETMSPRFNACSESPKISASGITRDVRQECKTRSQESCPSRDSSACQERKTWSPESRLPRDSSVRQECKTCSQEMRPEVSQTSRIRDSSSDQGVGLGLSTGLQPGARPKPAVFSVNSNVHDPAVCQCARCERAHNSCFSRQICVML